MSSHDWSTSARYANTREALERAQEREPPRMQITAQLTRCEECGCLQGHRVTCSTVEPRSPEEMQ